MLGVLVPQNSKALDHDISAQCSLVNVFRHPKLKSSVEGAGGDEFSVRGDVQSHHFPLVTSERLQRGPLRVCPYFGRVVIRSGQQVLSIGGLELNGADQVLVCGDGVDAAPLPQVPHLTGVVPAARSDVKPIRREVDAVDLLEVTFQEHNAATGPQIPHSPESVQTSSCSEGAIEVKGEVIHPFTVTLLMQNFLLRLQVPQAPGLVIACGA